MGLQWEKLWTLPACSVRGASAVAAPGLLQHFLGYRRWRHGYTLFELVLVLAILVLLAAIVYPSLEGMYGDYRLTAAADMVRASWASARAHAMDEGRAYRFAVVPNKGNFRVAPDGAEFWAGGNSGNSSPEEAGPGLVVEDAVPPPVRFTSLDAVRNGVHDPAGEGTLPTGSVDSGQWSSVVTFLPDGTARAFGADQSARDDVEIVLHTNGCRPVVLQVRGLTGVVTTKSLSYDGSRP